MSFQVGQQIGDYEVLEILGAGGMGRVYKVRNVISDRVEALKILLPDLSADPELADRFLREIKMLASLSHPHIASLHTAMRVENRLVMIMEYIQGDTVQKAIKGSPLPVGKAMDYADQALSALAYAHQHSIIHRDVKPANFMVTPGGMIKLMDFGIARPTQDARLTQTGRTVGSLSYMSPEQIGGQVVDARSDIYSFGISLYEMTTGQLPFKGNSDFAIMAGHLHQQAVPPIQIDPRLPSLLNDIIMMAIAKDPAQRFQSADAFRNALKGVTSAATVVMPQAGIAPMAQQPATPPPPPPPAYNPPTTQAAPPVGPPLPPPVMAPAKSGHRGLYLAVGSLATVAVLGIGAWQIPQLLHTGAKTVEESKMVVQDPKTQPPVTGQTTPQTPQTTPTNPAVPATDPSTPVQQAQVQQTPTTPTTSAAEPNSNPTQAAATQPKESAPIAPVQEAKKPVKTVDPPSQKLVRSQPFQQAQVMQPQVTNPQEAYQSQQPKQTPTTPAYPSGPDPNQVAALEEAREQYIKIASREKSAQAGLARLEKAMAADNLGLRGDMVQARQQMGFYLNDAENALRSNNLPAAVRAMEKADRELTRIEAFLSGRGR